MRATLCWALGFLAAPVFAAPPALPLASDQEAPVQVQAGGKPIDVERSGTSALDVGDFDGDGVRDLLVGQYFEGRLRIYRNVGTNADPRFDSYTWFEADGKAGRVQEGCCIGFVPQLVDLDRDGLTDVVSGSWPGEIVFFRRAAAGQFLAGQPLRGRDGQPIHVGWRAAAHVADWNADGTLDLVVGTMLGEVHVLPGQFEGGQLVFQAGQKLAAGGEPISIAGGEAAPVIADWDGDGRLDLVAGTGHGSVLWYRNAGSRGQPKLEAARILIGESPSGWGGDERRAPDEWGLRVKPCVVDWNLDGQLDLLIGDICGGYQAKPQQTEAEQAEERKANDRLPELRKVWAATFADYQRLQAARVPENEQAAARDKLRRVKEEMARLQEIQEHYRPGYQHHGFVWLFLRKSAGAVPRAAPAPER
jgi:hypothetical protein